MDPVAYILNASDLRPMHQHNMVFEYANDTNLIVPNMFSLTIPQELQHISDWAKHHNLKLKQTNSLEIIISSESTHDITRATLLPWSHMPTRHGGDFSPWEREQIQSVIKK